jgi:hypothetical protein
MKTADFDLILAKKGHPLVTRDGRKVIKFFHIENRMTKVKTMF